MVPCAWKHRLRLEAWPRGRLGSGSCAAPDRRSTKCVGARRKKRMLPPILSFLFFFDLILESCLFFAHLVHWAGPCKNMIVVCCRPVLFGRKLVVLGEPSILGFLCRKLLCTVDQFSAGGNCCHLSGWTTSYPPSKAFIILLTHPTMYNTAA